MNRGVILTIFAVVMFSFGASAQRISYMKNILASEGANQATITISEDAGVQEVVSYVEQYKTKTPAKVPGFRYVIFHDSEQFANERAARALNEFRKIYKSVSSKIDVDSPTFRVIVGDCFNYEEAAILRNKIDDMYPDAALCDDMISLRILTRYQGQNNMLVERNGVVSGGVEFEDTLLDEPQVSGQEGVEVIETPADIAESDVSVTIKRPNTQLLESETEQVVVIETPVVEDQE
jgi:hypothetical protein